MYKILMLAKREFVTSVRTKSFIIGLIIAPLFMGGSLFAYMLLKDKGDTDDKKIVVIDHSGQVGEKLAEIADTRNSSEIYSPETGSQIKPKYLFELLEADSAELFRLKANLSEKVRNKEIHAFLEIGKEILYPNSNPEEARVRYYSENSVMDDIREWIAWPLNNIIRKLRTEELSIEDSVVKDLFFYHSIEGMGLITPEDIKSGASDSKASNMAESLLVPYILLLLMFMMVMMAAVPLLNAVMVEKTERIAEVLLGHVTPFQFMMGKVLGGVSVSLVGSSIYIIAGVVLATQFGYTSMVPFGILPWYFVFMLLNVVMIGSIMAALGAACNDSKDAQSLQFPAMLPLILPMFVLMPVIKDPLSSFSTGLSLFPPFTPMLMIVRQASPVTIPAWQPIVGLIGVVLFTLFSVWAGSKIFRALILSTGQKPKLITIIKYAFLKR